MPWPLSQDYNEAIQSPASNFTDADLKRGEAVTNAMGLPMPCSGNFADVYQVRCPDGSRWAVKCFTREVPGLRERYQRISAHLKQAKLPFTVDFSYLDQGIRVAGQWYPIIKMQWVEGLTLNQFVSRYVDKPAMLESLSQVWTRMATWLRAANVAHGDLQHGNILLVPGAGANSLALKLIDYDGMWVPALANKRSGEVGHGNYQHPQRLREGTYNAEVDRFPLLLIATALRALTVKGKELWDKYNNGDNLLFKEADLLAPLKSLLFLDLTKLADPVVALQVDCLVKALRQGLDLAPTLEEVAAVPLQQEPRPAPLARLLPVAQVIGPVANNSASVNEPWYRDASSYQALTAVQPREKKSIQKGGASVSPWLLAGSLFVLAGGVALAGAFAVWAVRGSSNAMQQGNDPNVTTLEGKEKTEPFDYIVDGEMKTGTRRMRMLDLGGGVMMELVRIPHGTFKMGSPDTDWNAGNDEKPQHEVEITKDFYLGEYLVTQEQYNAVSGESPSGFSTFGANKDHVIGLDTRRFPVENVSWDDAQAFCQKLSATSHRKITLPTESQWEYACRAGTSTRFPQGDELTSADANFELKLRRTSNVDFYSPNAFGLYDMTGNVWEWCSDYYDAKYYHDGVKNDPENSNETYSHVVRGGSWFSPAVNCRAASRRWWTHGVRNSWSGFRVSCHLPMNSSPTPKE